MTLAGVRDLIVAHGADAPLLDGITFHVERGERVALVGRNGTGKSTLLRVLAGELEPDGGEVLGASGLRIARLEQEVPRDVAGEIFDVVATGMPEIGELLAEYHRLSHVLEDARDLARLEEVQRRLDAADAWQRERRVESALSRLRLPAEGRFETLSGGLKRRVLLARALVAEPDLLLLDEPTNHLDIPAIEWLEELLLDVAGTVIFVTHDRAFLRKIATRILELDRGRLSDWPGDYQHYLGHKKRRLAVEAEQNARFDKKLAQEEAWIRQGIKARRTRDEGRVRALERLREERRLRRRQIGEARLRMDDAERSGKIVIEAENVAFGYREASGDSTGETPLFADLTTTILRGDKVGILGPNGSGKTTLIKVLLGQLEPTAGSLRHGVRLEVAYFDQYRDPLDDERSVADNVAEGSDKVIVAGQPRHVISYLQDFLFPAAQTRSPVKSLSGGERNRLLLARLFTRPFNLLVMDEPTNDLDVETLEILEARLVSFEGTLLLVSHDRAFLDNVVTSTLVLEGGGRVGEYAGGYEDWLVQRPPEPEEEKPPKTAVEKVPRQRTRRAAGPRKLGYREKEELAELPERIEALELERGELHDALGDPELYRGGDGDGVMRANQRLAEVERQLETAYQRWEELEARA